MTGNQEQINTSNNPESYSSLSRKTRFWLIAPPIAWAALIFTLSSIPAEDLPPIDIINADKLAHMFVYAVLGFLAMRAFRISTSIFRLPFVVMALCVIYGLTDEFHQQFIPGRVPSVYDFIADSLGSIIGTWAWILFEKRKTSTTKT